jgi:DNA repair exonuclease SbcCD nuclease subunit
MKFLATADWQAGVTTLTLEQQEPVWHQIVDLAIEHDVAGVLHAGDLLEGPTLSTEVLAAIRRVFARLRGAGIPVLLIRGNGRHDLATRDVDGIDLFHDYPMITVSQRPELVVFGGAYVVTLPWVSPKHLIASSNGASRDNVYEATAEHLVSVAGDLRKAAGTVNPVILMLHWSVSGASLPTGLPVDQLRDVILPLEDLQRLGFDAIVAGHIHAPAYVADGAGWIQPDGPWTVAGDVRLDTPYGPAFYCGSPQPLNHGEGNTDHGAWLLDVAHERARLEFLPLDAPQFVTLDLAADDLAGDVVKVYGEDRQPIVSPGDIVRVRYTTTRDEEAVIDKEHVRRALLEEGAARVTIEPNIIREARARSENLTEALTERDALFAYCGAQDIGDGLRDRMMARTAEWL